MEKLLVDQITDGKSTNVSALESKLEELIMDVYKLNNEEKEIIRNS
jgi:hypothetical protein